MKLLKEMSFALIPRILNPNKGVKDDVEIEYYTESSQITLAKPSHFAGITWFWPTWNGLFAFHFGIFGAILSSVYRPRSVGCDLIAFFYSVALRDFRLMQSVRAVLLGAVVYLVITRRLFARWIAISSTPQLSRSSRLIRL